ncbi:MAG: hypothetical protein PHY14_00375 [Candidatus Gracilibacteria bacterium]|nr:hypothetical protein [Candidatus Gracilibacteria bacterium]
MKKGIFVIITLLAVLSQVFIPTFAAVSEKGPISNSPIESVGTKTGTLVQPMGFKSWIVKKAMQAIAYSLRYAISSVGSFLKSIGAPAAIVNEITNKAIPLATTLERVAIYFDYYSATTKNIITQQLQAQGFSANVAFWVAQIVDFVSF